MSYFTIVFVVIILIFGFYGAYKPLPKNVNYISQIYQVNDSDIQLLIDKAFLDSEGKQHFEQVIFNTMLSDIASADNYILADLFLFNDQLGQATSSYRQLSGELAQALVDKSKTENPPTIHFITDPINSAYGSYTPKPHQEIADAGIELITTDLTALRDSNPIYSAFWRSILRYTPDIGGNWLPNPFDPNHTKATLSSYIRGLNFKANHHKVLLTDKYVPDGQEWHTIVTSMNPHDGSSQHSNIGLRVKNALAKDVILTEQAVADFSGKSNIEPAEFSPKATTGNVGIQLLTENAIKKQILENIKAQNDNDEILLVMFYLSDRDVITALKEAAERGVKVKIILDPNKNAFGREKNGIPNRPVAHELMKGENPNLEIRWCATKSEQCHSKILITKSANKVELILGSANFTRRNLDNLNLETNVRVIGNTETKVTNEATKWFDELWTNADNRTYTYPYEKYREDTLYKTIWYRLGEYTGISHY